MIASLQSDLGVMQRQVTVLSLDHAALKSEVAINTAITRRTEANTKDIVDAVANLSSLWAFLSLWGARFRRWSFFTAKWLGVVAGAIVAVWSAANVLFHVDLSAWLLAWWRR